MTNQHSGTGELLLQVDGLSVRKGHETLVSSVSFSLAAGGRLGIVGETGSGKSLTCRALVGGLDRQGLTPAGTVRYAGTDLIGCSARTWTALRGRAIGFVPQSSLNSLDPRQRVGRQIHETLKALGSGVRAHDLLDQVRMPDPARVLRSYPHQLSGGMKQRLMIALAVAGRPRMLVADEPTTALDVSVQRAILDLLVELCKASGMALVLVTHDLGIVRDRCDTVLVLREGEQIDYGPTATVLDKPRHPYTRQLTEAVLTINPQGAAS